MLAKQYPQLVFLKISVVGYQPHIASEEAVITGDVTQVEHDIIYIECGRELLAGICKTSVTVAGYLCICRFERTDISFKRRQ